MVRYLLLSTPLLAKPVPTLRLVTGVYTAIFVMYLQYRTSKKGVIDNIQSVLFSLICILYVLSIVTLVGDTMDFIFTASTNFRFHNMTIFFNWLSQYLESNRNSLIPPLAFLQITVTGLCDFLAQCILVRLINHSYLSFLFIRIFRYTVAGLRGVVISVS